MAEAVNLKKVIIWGEENDDKSTSPIRWNHDYILFATYEDKLSVLDDPAILIPYIFDLDKEEITSHELYDGVYEFKTKDLVVELIEGLQYSEYKIYGKDVDFDAIMQRLRNAGATLKKPKITVDVPGKPPLVDVENLNKQRFNYSENKLERDQSLSRNLTIKAVFKTIFGLAAFFSSTIFLGIQIFVPKFQDVSPTADDMFIAMKGSYLVYNIDNRMTIFKFAESIEEIGYDSTYKLLVPEGMDVRDKIIVNRMTKADGDVIYDLGNRIIDFEPDPADYNFVNARTYEFNSYGRRGESDWMQYGELSKGRADKVILQGRVIERDGRYLLILGTVFAVLGEVSETGPQFYDLLGDDISYASVIYSLKAHKLINVYGQIDRTLSSREGRNSVDKLAFTFKTDFARKR